jgi:hypothetical protein
VFKTVYDSGSSVVEWLLSMYKALGSIPSTAKPKQDESISCGGSECAVSAMVEDVLRCTTDAYC